MPPTLSTKRRHAARVWPRLTVKETEVLQLPGVCRCLACGYPGIVHTVTDDGAQVHHPARAFTYGNASYPIYCRVPADCPNVTDAVVRLEAASRG